MRPEGHIAATAPLTPRQWCILWRVQTGRRPGADVFAAADVHYLPSGEAHAAAVVAADATFCHLLADRTGRVAEVPPYQPASSPCANCRRCTRSWTAWTA